MFEICKIIPVTVYQLSALSRTLHLESSIPKTKQLCSVFNILICKPQYWDGEYWRSNYRLLFASWIMDPFVTSCLTDRRYSAPAICKTGRSLWIFWPSCAPNWIWWNRRNCRVHLTHCRSLLILKLFQLQTIKSILKIFVKIFAYFLWQIFGKISKMTKLTHSLCHILSLSI